MTTAGSAPAAMASAALAGAAAVDEGLRLWAHQEYGRELDGLKSMVDAMHRLWSQQGGAGQGSMPSAVDELAPFEAPLVLLQSPVQALRKDPPGAGRMCTGIPPTVNEVTIQSHAEMGSHIRYLRLLVLEMESRWKQSAIALGDSTNAISEEVRLRPAHPQPTGHMVLPDARFAGCSKFGLAAGTEKRRGRGPGVPPPQAAARSTAAGDPAWILPASWVRGDTNTTSASQATDMWQGDLHDEFCRALSGSSVQHM